MCTSPGVPTWELQVVAAARAGVPQTIVVPVLSSQTGEFGERCRQIAAEFNLSPLSSETEFVALLAAHVAGRKAAVYHARDEAIAQMADLLVPLSIRPGGALAAMIETWRARGKEVLDAFQVPYVRRCKRLKYALDGVELDLDRIAMHKRFIVHWTRGTNRPWPTESAGSFYTDILNSACYPRDALSTLRAILRTGRIVASSRHMPLGTPCVCFSGLPPADMVSLVRWRARYREMSFEPYGIGIERETVLRMGVHPVVYYERSSRCPPPPDDAWLRQSSGAITCWRNEDEYRSRGDFPLRRVPCDAVVVFCHTAREAHALRAEFGLRVAPFVDH